MLGVQREVSAAIAEQIRLRFSGNNESSDPAEPHSTQRRIPQGIQITRDLFLAIKGAGTQRA